MENKKYPNENNNDNDIYKRMENVNYAWNDNENKKENTLRRLEIYDRGKKTKQQKNDNNLSLINS